MKRLACCVILAAAIVTLASLAPAAVPRLVNYQGTVTGPSGPIDGNYALSFAIYADSIGGTALWTESHATVPVTFGLFNVILGRFTPLPDNLFSAVPRWLGVTVDADPEIAPRMRMTAVPWAMRAALAESSLVSAPDADWAYSGANIYRMTGNVGIGTSTPAYKLDVRDLTADAYLNVAGQDDGKSGLHLHYGSAYLYYDEAAPEVRLWNAVTGGNAGDIAFGTNNVERMRIKRDGQVGIGVLLPADKLEVAGTAKMTGFKMPTGAASGYVLTSDATGVGTWQAATGGGSDGDWTISGSNQYSAVPGNVGIGISSGYSGKLHVVTTANDQAAYFELNDPSGDSSVVYAKTNGRGYGVYGINYGGNYGALGCSNNGVTGHNKNGNWGVLGYSATSSGVYGTNSNDNRGALATTDDGAWGRHNAGNEGHLGTSDAGVMGENNNGNSGYLAGASLGAYGRNAASQNYGQLGATLYGVYGYHNASTNYGYIGGDTCGVYGYTSVAARAAVYGQGGGLNGYGVRGHHNGSGNYGLMGHSNAGVLGRCYNATHSGVIGYYSNNIGSLGKGSAGVDGWSPGGYGVHGGTTSGYAGYFDGDVHVAGTLSKSFGSFVIDHPLDPENKILRHMFVESPEALCLYRGKITLDAAGEAIVTLPSYFTALTKEEEATVSLTPIGKPFIAGYEWMSGHSAFKVYGEAGREISWVAYADRDDPAARKLARPVEEDKGPQNKLCDRGRLLNP